MLDHAGSCHSDRDRHKLNMRPFLPGTSSINQMPESFHDVSAASMGQAGFADTCQKFGPWPAHHEVSFPKSPSIETTFTLSRRTTKHRCLPSGSHDSWHARSNAWNRPFFCLYTGFKTRFSTFKSHMRCGASPPISARGVLLICSKVDDPGASIWWSKKLPASSSGEKNGVTEPVAIEPTSKFDGTRSGRLIAHM